MCDSCLGRADEELAEHYAFFSTKYWGKPLTVADVLPVMKRHPSFARIEWYDDPEKGRVTKIINMDGSGTTLNWKAGHGV